MKNTFFFFILKFNIIYNYNIIYEDIIYIVNILYIFNFEIVNLLILHIVTKYFYKKIQFLLRQFRINSEEIKRDTFRIENQYNFHILIHKIFFSNH